MKNLITSFLLLIISITAAEGQTTLTIADITSGKYAAARPGGINPYTNPEQYTMLSNNRKAISIYGYKDGKAAGTLVNIAASGIPSLTSIDGYTISEDGRKVLLQTRTKSIYRRSFTAVYYLYDAKTKTFAAIADTAGIQAPVLSADGGRIAYVKDNDIYIQDLAEPASITRITTDGERGKIINGIPDWVYEEEFSFNCAMAFTPSGEELCWIKYDETNVRGYSLQMFKGQKPTFNNYKDYPGEYTYKYPKAGYDNSIPTAWTYQISTGQTRQISLPVPEEGYITRVLPGHEPHTAYFITMNRHQDRLTMHKTQAQTATVSTLIEDYTDKYIKEDVLSFMLLTRDHILLPSERSGKMTLYLYDRNGKLLREASDPRLIVTDVYGYDQKTGNTYYQAVDTVATERAVYVTRKDGTTECLTPTRGWNTAAFSHNYRYFIHSWSNADTPWQYTIADKKGRTIKTIEDNHALRDKLAPLSLAKKQFFRFTTTEGVELNGVMILPYDFDESRQYPVVMHQYSGPGSQQVVNSWSLGSVGAGALFDHYLTTKGIIVVIVDGRGTGGRGAEFEKCTYLHLGDKEAKDQVETALWLSRQPYVDADNIGIWGWSYGGFCTLMSMSEGRGVFKAGVAIAAPTNWKYYDTVYTERFMRTPRENQQGYEDNPISRAQQLHGALLLCHGLADDNVHPQNIFEYTESLVQKGKDFRELIYTNRNHSIYGGNTRHHLLRQVTDFFLSTLK